jgi:hypothetical protein
MKFTSHELLPTSERTKTRKRYGSYRLTVGEIASQRTKKVMKNCDE